MKNKWPLFIGIILLSIGIVLRKTTDFKIESLLILLTGVAFKIAYIIILIIRKEYKPGFEITFLLVGICFFMGGIILHKQGLLENPFVIKMIGISLKALFILLFVKKLRQRRKQDQFTQHS